VITIKDDFVVLRPTFDLIQDVVFICVRILELFGYFKKCINTASY